ncbi:MAG: Pyrroloquinoline quinone (PQQ) biosynthesis protein C [Chloroflexi bacterium]|jgi:pyrroloquinoline quinone (PQQ) biosynthesis protein C|nr:MAG: Pyrroloquinoline quinone (PQQ) biosynthesis protein C [Chloroflexota bacterium]
MTTDAKNSRFVDEVIQDIIQPGVEQLMDSRYFTDLRSGKLTTRRLQGFSIQHYIHNMGVLKLAALGAVQRATDDGAFLGVVGALNEEVAHPVMARKFGLALGLTEADFDRATPAYGCLLHTAACLHGVFLGGSIDLLTLLLSNETMVQRYATEFNTYLREHYDVPEDAMEFFTVHMGADIEHTARSANTIAVMATSDEDQERVRVMCRNMARLKLGKFDSIYEEYA